MSKPLDGLIYTLNIMVDNTKKLDPLLENIAIDMKKQTLLNFKQQRTPEGDSWKKNTRGGQTLAKTGILKSSITTYTDNNSAAIGTNIPYARLHQFGGIIKPKRGKYLAIPLNEKFQGSSPRDFNNTICIKVKEALFIVRKIDKRGNGLEFLFKLQKEIVVPQRKFIGITDKMKIKYVKMTKQHILE